MTRTSSRSFVAALLALVASPAALAQDSVAQFYRGRQITLIIPSSAGGGFDLYGRLVARHLGRLIPGNPNVVPSNMGGAAGVVAAQYIYSAGAKDGSALAELYPNAIMEPLLGDRTRVKYDSLRFNAIGSVNSETAICFVRSDTPIKSFEDVFTQEVVFGASGRGGPSTDYPALYDKSARRQDSHHQRLSRRYGNRACHRERRTPGNVRIELVGDDHGPPAMAARRNDAAPGAGESQAPSLSGKARRAADDQLCANA
jgi:hypothetical protein